MSTGPPAHAPATVAMTAEWARALVESQHPDLLGPVRPFANGWDNDVFRLGEAYLLRLPRRELGREGHRREVTYLPRFVSRLPVPAPLFVRQGSAEGDYPFAWSITPWFEGQTLLDGTMEEAALARGLASFLTALHQPAETDAPREGARSSLTRRDEDVRHALRWIDADHRDVLGEAWTDALAAPSWNGPAVWVHGDLHPANVLVHDGRLAAVLDWGDLFAGDPATDYAIGWMTLGSTSRALLFAGADAALIRRARGWAVYFAAVLSKALCEGAGAGFAPVVERLIRELCGSSSSGRIMREP